MAHINHDSTEYVCDRCGRSSFTLWGGWSEVLRRNEKTRKKDNYGRTYMDGYHYDEYDLCDQCAASFDAWLKAPKLVKSTLGGEV